MSACWKVGSDVNPFTKELAIRRVNESRRLMEGSVLCGKFLSSYSKRCLSTLDITFTDREWCSKTANTFFRKTRHLLEKF